MHDGKHELRTARGLRISRTSERDCMQWRGELDRAPFVRDDGGISKLGYNWEGPPVLPWLWLLFESLCGEHDLGRWRPLARSGCSSMDL